MPANFLSSTMAGMLQSAVIARNSGLGRVMSIPNFARHDGLDVVNRTARVVGNAAHAVLGGL